MRIQVRDLGFERKKIEGEDPPSILELGRTREDRLVRDPGPIAYDLSVYLASGKMMVEGRVWTTACFRCVRCMEFFRMDVSEPSFVCVADVPEDNEFADLTPQIREAMLLHFPAHPVCRDSCLGLCPRCGRSRERSACDCRAEDEDDTWSGLDRLRLD